VNDSEEWALWKRPWVYCKRCGTLRHPDAVTEVGICRDEEWCLHQKYAPPPKLPRKIKVMP
jgi:hypothetical protein